MGGAVNMKEIEEEQNKMEEGETVEDQELYEFVPPRIVYYLKSNNIARIFKKKSPLFAVGGEEKIINLFSNSLEHMGYFSGHKHWIRCLCAKSNKILASGSWDMTIKIWNIEDRSIMSTLSGHRRAVSALCNIKEGVLVSGSDDSSLIIWSKSPPESSTYSPRRVRTGHTSSIMGIIRLNDREFVSGECSGDLMMWNIDEGLCIRHIPRLNGFYGDNLTQMKQHIGGDVVVGYGDKVKVWGTANNWGENPIKQFDVCEGWAIEFLSGDLLLRGGFKGQLEFIDYGEIGCTLPPKIEGLHSEYKFIALQKIAKNIVITASADGSLKVIDLISISAYLSFQTDKRFEALAYLY